MWTIRRYTRCPVAISHARMADFIRLRYEPPGLPSLSVTRLPVERDSTDFEG